MTQKITVLSVYWDEDQDEDYDAFFDDDEELVDMFEPEVELRASDDGRTLYVRGVWPQR